jgi:hypothetical protein
MLLLLGDERRDLESMLKIYMVEVHPLEQYEDDFVRWQQDLRVHRQHNIGIKYRVNYF